MDNTSEPTPTWLKLLAFAIVAVALVFAVNGRYRVTDDQRGRTHLVDTWMGRTWVYERIQLPPNPKYDAAAAKNIPQLLEEMEKPSPLTEKEIEELKEILISEGKDPVTADNYFIKPGLSALSTEEKERLLAGLEPEFLSTGDAGFYAWVRVRATEPSNIKR